jgi:membrane protease subunit HflC
MKKVLLGILIVAAIIVVPSTIYIVDETQQVVITMFGQPIGAPITTPGLKVKVPFVHKATFFPKVLLEWDGEQGQVPTKDKTFIWVDVFARWRIAEPLKYLENVSTETNAHRKLDGIIDAAVRNLITSNPLIETVRNTNRKMDISETIMEEREDDVAKHLRLGRSKICMQILGQARPKLAEFGIDLVDVRFKRINYVDDVLRKVYERMIAERKQIAEKYRAEGKGESQKIAGEKEKELKRIFSEAYKTSQTIKGKADAKAAKTYAAAYGRDHEFYTFVKSLDLYRTSIDSSSTAVFSTESDFLRYLKDGY